MNHPTASKTRSVWDIAALLARWVLGALFIYMGMTKALHPVDFLKLIHQYDLVQNHLVLNAIAATLPWFEVFCGLVLLAGVAVRGSALLLIAMLVPFTWIVFQRALAIQAAQHISFCAVKFDCGCGGGEVFICQKLPENLLLLALAIGVLSGRGRNLCTFLKFRRTRSSS
jgi:uncharacterized membrane protein YphA (DoxX/SURF4 family)